MRIFTTLAVILILQACKHPLAVVGEGDIVDANNSGHGCTLEQFLTQDTACSENEVSGNYFVNYKAEPRPGWRFVRWEGPCSQQSDFQYCRIDAEEDWVSWMDETYPDYEIPPSTAVFEPITGVVGYLGGGPAAGVAYESPSYQGFTNLDGSFEYAQGETVRFLIGDTVLGEVVGRAEVTPFDLAGSAVVTGIDITWALEGEDDPFRAVINLAVLLHSLDHDADPDNGIQISPDVAALFRGVSLNLSQHWRSFQMEPRLRHALGQANREQRFNEAHGIVKPAVALEHLYAALAIDPQTVGVTVRTNGDGADDSAFTEHWQYDANGNVTRHESETLGFESWQYDADGNVTRYERDALLFNMYDEVQTRHYDANGNETRHEFDGDANGTPERIIRYQYNADGNPTHVQVDDDLDDAPSGGFETWQYDVDGSLTQYRQAWHEADGREGFESEQYDASGNITRFESHAEQISGSTRHQIESWQYDRDDNVTRQELDRDADGSPERAESWHYDAEGKPTRYENDADGVADEIETWHYQYDANGQVTRTDRVDAVAGELAEVEIWQYDANSNVTRYENMAPYECADICEGVLPNYRLELWQYHANGTVMLHEITATEHFWIRGNFYQSGGNRSYHYDANGNLTRFATGEPGDGEIISWQYNENGKLTRAEEDSDDNGRPEHLETWQYDLDGNLTRYDRDENGDGAIEETTTYQYEATGWGHLLSDAEVWGHRSPPPLKPRPDAVYLE